MNFKSSLFFVPALVPRSPPLFNASRGISTISCSRRATTIGIPLPVQESLQTLPYHVHRTASQRLPVYHLKKRGGGNLHQTKIRKISGSIEQLRHDIQQALGLTHEQIVINQLTRHIIIKGWMKADVERFLEQLRF